MKVFVSWSGARSKAVAELISDWIKCVLQASQPWISTRDIDKGAIWFSEISDQLKDTAAGIVCLTQENKNKPWILFETGALAKGLSTNRVCTFLIDLAASDIEDPLAQFNHTFPEKSSMWGLTCSLNSCLDVHRLDERILKQVFDTYWPQFKVGFDKAIEDTPQEESVVPRTEESILAEILSNTRTLNSRVRELETRASAVTSFTTPAQNLSALEDLVRMAKSNSTLTHILNAAKVYGVPDSDVSAILKEHRFITTDENGQFIRRRRPSKNDNDE